MTGLNGNDQGRCDVSPFREHIERCPDPERALKNIETFLMTHPGLRGQFAAHAGQIALLFSVSQFLATFSTRNPEVLFTALRNLNRVQGREDFRDELRTSLAFCNSLRDGVKTVRLFKKKHLLVITLRDILKKGDPQETMLELSDLADAVIAESLPFVESFLRQRFGTPVNNGVVIIGLGKLGAREINYSSDIDIIVVYRDEGETSGVTTPQGASMNRISAFEYYVKVTEELNRFLSSNTEDGFAYRVDLRLRPQGQRGSLAISLRGCEEYYESWGQLWERAALIRSRPVAGDIPLGREFLESVRPFVYRKYLDFDAIEEIRRMKGQVENLKPGTVSLDIKRGYGGIREIEFFIQVFQLIYGGRVPLLRERSTLMALHRLMEKRLIGHDDFQQILVNYVYLRTLEHRLQQLNDVQTHTLPTQAADLDILGRKMGFPGREEFLSDLDRRRGKVREIYDSLLEVGQGKKAAGESKPDAGTILSSVFWDMEMPIEHLLKEELSKAGARDIARSTRCLMKIKANMTSFQTIRGRRLLENIVPRFVDDALRGADPDLALLQLVDFTSILSSKEAYLEAIFDRDQLIPILNFVFSNSEYLSKMLMSSPEYIESLVEGIVRKKTARAMAGEAQVLIDRYGDSKAIRFYRRMEEMRLGMLFLDRKISVRELLRALSMLAEVILGALLSGEGLLKSPSPPAALTVIGFGKLGGREITFNSDLDITFVTAGSPAASDVKTAETLLKMLMSYTKDGIAYQVDTRLRPEGSKGPLVNSLAGVSEYYLKSAKGWEIQALLKARTVFGSMSMRRLFSEMRTDVLLSRSAEITFAEMQHMRERIQRELSRERPGQQGSGSPAGMQESQQGGSYDIKLGPGGLGELEFSVQFLQLKHCREHADVLAQGTIDAVRRLHRAGVLDDGTMREISEVYAFYRTIETILRLRNETHLKVESSAFQSLLHITGMDADHFLRYLNEKRRWTGDFWNSLSG